MNAIYKSKVDLWLMAVMGVAILVILASVAIAAFSQSLVEIVLTAICGTVSIAFLLWILLSTQYCIEGSTLRITSGPFRWKIPIDSIASVKATRSPLSAPALSLDRLEIRYGRNRTVLVSPQDRTGFLQALGHQLDAESSSANLEL